MFHAHPRPPCACLRLPEELEKITPAFQATDQGFWKILFQWVESKIPKFKVLLLTHPAPCWSKASYISFAGATKPKEIGASARRSFLWFFFFVLFSLETNVRASEWTEGTKTLEGSIYVWQVFGEDSLVPRALPLENGRSRRHPSHFLTEKPWGRGCREEERHAST